MSTKKWITKTFGAFLRGDHQLSSSSIIRDSLEVSQDGNEPTQKITKPAKEINNQQANTQRNKVRSNDDKDVEEKLQNIDNGEKHLDKEKADVASVYEEYSSVQHLQLVKEVALGPESQVLIMNTCCVKGFKFQTEEVSRNKKTNNSGIYIIGDVYDTCPTIEYYGVIHEIIEVRYSGLPKKNIVLFWCQWFDQSHRGTNVDHQHNIIEVKHTRKYRSHDPFISAQNAKQVYYPPYPLRRDKADWCVVIKIDVELETTLQHPQHILEEVSDDEMLDVEEEIFENEEMNHLMTKNGTIMKIKQLRRKNARMMELKQVRRNSIE
ncbi:hypothetical protein RDI58_025161 [Solanum bulbocastanum]|uniref:DUF4216 domain-containing protein n=1 Tax=Solanum bulbocastanum TaxID=147425 RepID=A0AAN8SYY0_SOLBU